MIEKPIIHYLAIVFYKEENLELVPSSEMTKKSFPKFRLPRAPEGDDIEKILAQYGLRLQDGMLLEPIAVPNEKEISVAHVFLSYLPNHWNGIYENLPYDGFEKADLDELDMRIAKRFFYFYPAMILAKTQRSIPLEPEALARAIGYRNCVNECGQHVPDLLKLYFAGLIEAPSSPTRIRNAFLYLCKQYGFSMNDYAKNHKDRIRRSK